MFATVKVILRYIIAQILPRDDYAVHMYAAHGTFVSRAFLSTSTYAPVSQCSGNLYNVRAIFYKHLCHPHSAAMGPRRIGVQKRSAKLLFASVVFSLIIRKRSNA